MGWLLTNLGIILDDEAEVWSIGEDGQTHKMATTDTDEALSFFEDHLGASYDDWAKDLQIEWRAFVATVNEAKSEQITITLDARYDLLVSESYNNDDELNVWAERYEAKYREAAAIYGEQHGLDITVVSKEYNEGKGECAADYDDANSRIWQDIHNMLAGEQGRYYIIGHEGPEDPIDDDDGPRM